MEKFKSFSYAEYHSILKFEYPQIQFLLWGNFYFCQRNPHNFSAGNTMICLLWRQDVESRVLAAAAQVLLASSRRETVFEKGDRQETPLFDVGMRGYLDADLYLPPDLEASTIFGAIRARPGRIQYRVVRLAGVPRTALARPYIGSSLVSKTAARGSLSGTTSYDTALQIT